MTLWRSGIVLFVFGMLYCVLVMSFYLHLLAPLFIFVTIKNKIVS